MNENELDQLKRRADVMGIKYPAKVTLNTLRELVNDSLATPLASDEDKANSDRKKVINEASRLVRVKITCMDPTKRDQDGEIIAVGNAVVGTFKKYIPYNTDDNGYHVPNIIYQELLNRKCQIFVTVTRGGHSVKQGKLINAFSLQELPPLTPAEIKELARLQAAASGKETE